jgi:predicted small metal-binding protein
VKGKFMQKIIRCECGFVVSGTTDDELVKNAYGHILDAHPAMADGVTGEDLLGMAEIVA